MTLKVPLADLAAKHDDERHAAQAVAPREVSWREYHLRMFGKEPPPDDEPPRKEPDR